MVSVTLLARRAWQAACGSLVKADIICCLPFFLGLQCVRESTTAPVWELASCLPPPPHGLGLSKHPALACCASNRIQIEPDILCSMRTARAVPTHTCRQARRFLLRSAIVLISQLPIGVLVFRNRGQEG